MPPRGSRWGESEDNGPDIVENLLCLCPTCHVLFDAGAWSRPTTPRSSTP
ncbi:HNH endonuclease [Streptomyces sp. NBC_01353]